MGKERVKPASHAWTRGGKWGSSGVRFKEALTLRVVPMQGEGLLKFCVLGSSSASP